MIASEPESGGNVRLKARISNCSLEGPIPVDIGAWYINVVDPNEHGPDDELDLYVSVGGPNVLGFDTNLVYTAFFFPEGPWGTTHELAAGIGRDLFGFANWQTFAHYDFELDGWYFESALTKEYGLEQVAIEKGHKEPSPVDLRNIVSSARTDRVRVIFAEPQLSTESAGLVAREVGGRVVIIDPLPADWLAGMRQTAAAFKEALSP